ncbi:HAMP domain-containing protein [Patescibacteria group bacterium]|nr:HAMP domain-containing protein [Patescibacteria group bacterium]
MKLSIKYKLLLAFALVVLLSSLVQALAFSLSANHIKTQTKNSINDKTISAAEQIQNFFASLDLRLLNLANLYKNKLDLQAAQRIQQIAQTTAQQIESYIKTYPNKTIKDLQNDPVFQKIAVQQVGKTGYTALTDYNTLTCRFHTNPAIVDIDLHTLAEKLPGFWSVMSRTQGGKDAEGFYDWEEADGTITKKYMYIAVIGVKTADNVGLHTAATTYLDEFGSTMEELEDKRDIVSLTELTISENPFIKKITFLSKATREIIKIDRFGQIPSDQLSFEIPTKPFRLALAGEAGFSKVYYPGESATPQIDSFAPIVSRQNAVIGVIKAQINLSQLWDLIAQTKLGKSGFAYVVDDEGRLIAHPDKALLSQAPILTSRKIIAAALTDTMASLKTEDYYYRNAKNVNVVADAKRITGTNWVVVVGQFYTEAFALYILSQRLFLITLVISFSLLVVISLMLSESLTQPIRKLQAATQLLRQGNLNTKVKLKTGDEIEKLGNSFNLMAEQILQREHFLQSEKKQMETLMQSMDEGVFAVDQDKKIILFTKSAVKITNLSPEEVTGKDVDEALQFYETSDQVLFADYSKQDEHIKKVLKKKGLSLDTKMGSIVVALTVSPVNFEEIGKSGFIATIHDITKEQSLEEMKIDFVSIASHELRTPITSILGYLSILQEEASKRLNAEQKEFIGRALISAQRLEALMENLLSVSRVEKGQLNIKLEPTDWNQLISEGLEDFREQIKHSGIELKTSLQKELPPVLVDKLRIREVIHNLIGNAINYTAKGQIMVSTYPAADKKYVITSIQDSGQGIAKEHLSHLFTKFYRVSGILEQGSKGTGLGLYISRAIVEAHHGKIWVESELGKGSTFYFSVPISTPLSEKRT